MNLLCNVIATVPGLKMTDEPEELYKMSEIRIRPKRIVSVVDLFRMESSTLKGKKKCATE